MADPTLRELTIFGCIRAEQVKVFAKFGDQSGHTDLEWMSILTEEIGEAAECVCKARVHPIDQGVVQPALDNLEYELIQIATVCVNWLEAIRERDRW